MDGTVRTTVVAHGSVVKVLIDVAFSIVYFTSLVKGGWLTTSDPTLPPSVDSVKVRFSSYPWFAYVKLDPIGFRFGVPRACLVVSFL